MKRTLILMVGSLVLAGAVMAQDAPAPQPDNENSMDVQRPAMPVLTNDQQKALEKTRSDHAKEMIPVRAQLKVLRIEMKELIAGGESAKGIAKKQDEINKFQAKIAEARNNHIVKVRDIVGIENFKWMAGRLLNDRPGRGDFMDCPVNGFHPGMGIRGGFDDDNRQDKRPRRNVRPNCIRPDNPGFWDSF